MPQQDYAGCAKGIKPVCFRYETENIFGSSKRELGECRNCFGKNKKYEGAVKERAWGLQELFL